MTETSLVSTQTLSVHELDAYEYQGRLSCTQMAAEVCHKVWVVVPDPQGISEGVQDSLASGGWCQHQGLSIVGFR